MLKYFIAINIIELFLMKIDKKNAIKKKERVPEIVLFSIALLGGSLGGIIGMLIIHHKTKKWKFKLLFPIFLLFNIFVYFCI